MNVNLKIPLCDGDRVKEVKVEPTFDLTTESDKRMEWLGKRFAKFLHSETPSVFMKGLEKELARLNSPAVVAKKMKEMDNYFNGKKKS